MHLLLGFFLGSSRGGRQYHSENSLTHHAPIRYRNTKYDHTAEDTKNQAHRSGSEPTCCYRVPGTRDSCHPVQANRGLTSTATDPTKTPHPVPRARPNTSPAPRVSSEPGIKHTVVKMYTAAKATAPCPGLSSTHSRKVLRLSATKPSPGTCSIGK